MKSTFLFALTILMAGLSLASPSLRATASAQDFQVLRALGATWLEQQARHAFPDVEVQIEVAPVDARLRLAPCPAPQFFLAANARLWGRGSLGARCSGTANWTLYLSYQSRMRGPALVTTRPLPARHAPERGDLEPARVEYAESPALYPRELPPDTRLNRPVASGQAIRIDWLALPNVIQAGRKVAITVSGSGFSIAQEGTALNNAAPGETVRVKTPSGRVVQGIATREGRVEIRP